VRRRRARGYTLVEVVLVMTVVAIVVAVARPLLGSSLGEAALSAAVEETVAAVQFAQSSAVNEGRDHRVAFSDSLGRVTLTKSWPDSASVTGLRDGFVAEVPGSSVETTGQVPVSHPLRHGDDYVVDFANEPRFRGVTLSSVALGTKDQVTFDARGSPSIGGSVRLSRGGRGVQLTIDPVTGRVSRLAVGPHGELINE